MSIRLTKLSDALANTGERLGITRHLTFLNLAKFKPRLVSNRNGPRRQDFFGVAHPLDLGVLKVRRHRRNVYNILYIVNCGLFDVITQHGKEVCGDLILRGRICQSKSRIFTGLDLLPIPHHV